jgi:hypothetical protein
MDNSVLVGLYGRSERWGDRWAVECARTDEKEVVRRLSTAKLKPVRVSRSQHGSPLGYPVIAIDVDADDGEAVRQVLDALGFVVGQP